MGFDKTVEELVEQQVMRATKMINLVLNMDNQVEMSTKTLKIHISAHESSHKQLTV